LGLEFCRAKLQAVSGAYPVFGGKDAAAEHLDRKPKVFGTVMDDASYGFVNMPPVRIPGLAGIAFAAGWPGSLRSKLHRNQLNYPALPDNR
jgi:hypothetical protein